MTEQEKNVMSAVTKVTVEQVVQADQGPTSQHLHLDGIVIAGKPFQMDIYNTSLRTGEETLNLVFNDQDYTIIIDNLGLRVRRTLYRPDHDHSDMQDLLIALQDMPPDIKKGHIGWYSDSHFSPSRDNRWAYFYLTFDATQ